MCQNKPQKYGVCLQDVFRKMQFRAEKGMVQHIIPRRFGKDIVVIYYKYYVFAGVCVCVLGIWEFGGFSVIQILRKANGG